MYSSVKDLPVPLGKVHNFFALSSSHPGLEIRTDVEEKKKKRTDVENGASPLHLFTFHQF